MGSKRSKKCLLLLIVVFILMISGHIFHKNFMKKDKNSLINIADLSKEFLDNYFEEVSNIETEEEKDNILIVTTMNNLDEFYGATNIIEAPNNQYFLQYDSLEEKNRALYKFKETDSIISVDENDIVTFSDSNYNSWGIEKMVLDKVINNVDASKLEPVTVAIIDTGCDLKLINKYYSGKIVETYNVLTASTSDMSDTNGHGTHIAGTIAEGTPANVKILPVKVSTGSKQRVVDIITAINYIVANKKADVINMSFGLYSYNTSLYNAIEAANKENIISVAAAGNDNTSSSFYPAAYNNTISIASVDSNLTRSYFSNYGSTIDFAAPGSDIKSTMSKNMDIAIENGNTDGDDDHEIISGTSMATPHAVNAVAILKSYNKDLNRNNVVDLLTHYAVQDLGTTGKDTYFGYGFIEFNDDSFCNNKQDECEELGVFKKSAKDTISTFEVQYPIRTTKNYGTPNNFNNSQVKIYYTDGASSTTTLGELSGVDIIGYDAYDTKEQTITVKWHGKQTTFKFTNPTEWESGWTYEVIEDNKITLTGFTDFNYGNYGAKKLYIPEKIGVYDVVAIGKNNSGSSIFNGAKRSSYEEIVLPSTLTDIAGDYTFSDFEFVQKVTSLSKSLKISGKYVFSEDYSLVEVDGTIEKLGVGTFSKASSLQKVTLSDKLTELPARVFEDCISIKRITLPSSLKNIGDYAFYGTEITSINLPNSVETIGANVFYKVETLNSVSLSQNLKSIGDYAFAVTSITEIQLPDSLVTIGNNVFATTNLTSFHLPKNVTSIGSSLLIYNENLENITVDNQNTTYDSRNNSNAIIETATDTLLYGSKNTVIPSNIKKIANSAFYYVAGLEEIVVPEGVTEIGRYAFYGSTLKKVYVPSSVNTIGTQAFVGKDSSYITIWTTTNTYAKTYAVENLVPYEAMNISYIASSLNDYRLKAFDVFEPDIYIYFDRGAYSGSSYKEYKKVSGRKEIISIENVEVIYPGNKDHFEYGDSTVIVKGTTNYGEFFEKTFDVTIYKLTPTYQVPTDLTAELGQRLSEIALPSGFEWMNPDAIIEDSGNVIFKAKFTPEDSLNYEIVENIDISVNIKSQKEVIVPSFVIKDKIYDGTKDVSFEDITISNLNASEYIIESAKASSADAGNRFVTIKLKLTDEKFKNYTFDNGKQDKEFLVSLKIVPQVLKKPSLKISQYTYNGSEQAVELNDYQEEKMNILGNLRTNAGEQNVVISLKNKNYIWDDNTSNDVTLKFIINKADPNIDYSSSGLRIKYDGKSHGINLIVNRPSNALVKYMDENGEYTLDDMPKYSNVGEYNIKFKIFIDDNYTYITDDETLEIIKNVVTNNTKDNEVVYDGKEHTIKLDVKLDNYTVKYSVDNKKYNLSELPKFKDVGEYTIYYKITSSNHETLESSNKVKIYGVKGFNDSVKVKKNMLILNDNSFSKFTKIINIYSISKKISHLDNSKKVINNNTIKTGDYVSIKINNLKTIEYQLVYVGDVNGNGQTDIIDYIRIMKDIMGITKLSGVYYEAADVNNNNVIDIIDYIRIMKIIMEEK